MMPIRILLADDHTLVRAGIRALLAAMPDMQVIGEATDGDEALSAVERDLPDLVLMDIMMPRLNGLEALRRMSRDFPRVRVLVLSMNAGEEFVATALRNGAAGYLLKNVSPDELQRAVLVVARGEIYLSRSLAERFGDRYAAPATSQAGPLERLTSRQREVLQLVAEGLSTKEIARKLGVTVNTVEAHRTQLMKTLDIHEVAGLVRFAIRTGVISVDS